MSCPATPEKPCFCHCHRIMDFEGNPLTGGMCNMCPVFREVDND